MENYRDELVQDQNFIRCSVLIAELLIKYRNQDAKDNENHKEPDMGSVTYHLLTRTDHTVFWLFILAIYIIIVYNFYKDDYY